jgi:hypothetical protein
MKLLGYQKQSSLLKILIRSKLFQVKLNLIQLKNNLLQKIQVRLNNIAAD